MEQEKIIEGLDLCLNNGCGWNCPYSGTDGCEEDVLKDALALLKKQREIIKALESDLNDCKTVIAERSNVVRCKNCKYNSGRCQGIYIQFVTCYKTGTPHKEDWFCADGKRRDDDA